MSSMGRPPGGARRPRPLPGVARAAPPPGPVDGDDEEEPDLRPSPGGEGIVEMTGQGKEGSKYLSDGGVYVYNRTNFDLDSTLLQEGAVDVPLGEGPQILIVHTHGSEAYSQTDGDI